MDSVAVSLFMDYHIGAHSDRRLPSKNYNRGKNGREEERRKTENDVTGLD